MKSLQDKYARNKARKLTVLETHKRSSNSTNECLTSHNNSETVCDNNNCDKSSTISIQIRVITKLPNSKQSYKGKVKTHNYINRQNQSTTGKL